MQPSRRRLLAGAGLLTLAPLPLLAQGTTPSERSAGPATAPVTVIEYFSLTCGHCAAFHRDTWPRVKTELVQAGKIRMVWRDFPLDNLAAVGAMVARALPPERYEPFIGTLLTQQDQWAFSRDPRAGLARLARLAGMSTEQFDATVRDQSLLDEIVAIRERGEAEHKVESTPTFVFNNTVVPGNIPFDRFASEVAAASS